MKSNSKISKFFSFISDVRQETDKITWPSRRDVIITTVIVFALAVIASIFFSIVDTVVYHITHSIIGK